MLKWTDFLRPIVAVEMVLKGSTNLLDSLPGMGHIAGRRRFRQYVADPIPAHVRDVRGGFRGGFKSGIILTCFEYDSPFDRGNLLCNWDVIPPDRIRTIQKLVLEMVRVWRAAAVVDTTQGYTKPQHPYGGTTIWLLLDESSGKGVLYDASLYWWENRRKVEGVTNLPARLGGTQYDEVEAATHYLLDHYAELLTDFERRALRVWHSQLRGIPSGQVKGADNILQALHDDPRVFCRGVRDRVLRDHVECIVINRCPACKRIVRTPRAQHCLWCGHDWHAAAK